MNNHKHYQIGITENLSQSAYYVLFSLVEPSKLQQAMTVLLEEVDGQSVILGLGEALMANIDDVFYHPYQAKGNALKLAPESKGYDLALWIKANDLGDLFHRVSAFISQLKPAFEVQDIVQGITHHFYEKDNQMVNHGLDEFEDGTENPQGADVEKTAISDSGASYWSLQKWQHDFDKLKQMQRHEKERLIGRSLQDNHEFDDNQAYAHVARTAQESFEPEAFIWRRSMPWIDSLNQKLVGGLMFSSFAHSFYPFDVQFNRMLGNEDEISDGVFEFSKVIYTAFFYCPPMKDNQLDLSTFLHAQTVTVTS
ncbi:Dyp-type peroxidase [Thiotrichales bacterium 19S3-7]|nr:Dyp-type peroxidase [Thiotrichales bacterium 19S3-7]MCF6801621.1 Dyp-type peroxidase [Thiotrichales bacterium 19S3-11]